MNRILLLTFFGLTLSGFFNLNAKVNYVTPGGAGTKTGTSWSNAYDAVAFRSALPSASYGDTFWVARGHF